MTDDALIAKQTRKIADLEERLKAYQGSVKAAMNTIYCIGGPLNDNKLEYTKEQMFEWSRVSNYLKWITQEDDE